MHFILYYFILFYLFLLILFYFILLYFTLFSFTSTSVRPTLHDAVLSTLQTLVCPHDNLIRCHNYWLHFTNKETEAQRSKVVCRVHLLLAQDGFRHCNHAV